MSKKVFLLILTLFLVFCSAEIILVKRGGIDVESYRLNNNVTMPVVGFGTSQLGNASETKSAIKTAIISGYRLIDTATRYDNEAEIGEALEELIKENKIKREDVFITTKVWPNFFTKDRLLQSIRDSLQRLKLDRLDLVLLHFPAGFQSGDEPWPIFDNGSVIPLSWKPDGYLETWKAMEEAVRLNLTQSIGISNFNERQTDLLMKNSEIKPVINQVECNPLFNQESLLRNHKKHNIILQAYAPIGRANPKILTNKVIQTIGEKYNKTSTQVTVRWLVDRGAALVIKSSKPKRIMSNLDVSDFKLNAEEIAQIEAIPQEKRAFEFQQARMHPDFPF